MSRPSRFVVVRKGADRGGPYRKEIRDAVFLIDGSDWDGLEDNVKFRLTYEGPLMSSGNRKGTAAHKHEIRKKFHPQLKQLWQIEPNLINFYAHPHYYEGDRRNGGHRKTPVWEAISHAYKRDDYRFVPFAPKMIGEFSLLIGVDILLLRQGIPGKILKQGDIDGRLKTLFDALRMPSNQAEFGGYIKPDDDEDPFFVLMEDDNLLNHVSVETDILLQPTPEAKNKFDPNDARVIITVTTRPYWALPDYIGFVGN